ncbi:MAG: hypothetical protein K8U57_34040 [Planctomycetes bacterium]|nr:hypothetical protein [Planctomycetota bacterium]
MKTRTTIVGLLTMLARPILDAIADERTAWAKRRPAVPCPAPVVVPVAEVATPEPAPVAIPAPTELAVVDAVPAPMAVETPVAEPTVVEIATVEPEIVVAPTVATVVTTTTKKVRARKPTLVMAGASRTTTKRTRAKVEPEAVEPAEEKPATEPDTFRVRMCDTKSDGSWMIAWTPITGPGPTAGVLTIDSKRSHAKYAVMEFPTGWAGRGFTLAKLQGGTDRDNGDYSVFCSQHGPEADSCDCKGSSRFDHCKHRRAIRALILNDKL